MFLQLSRQVKKIFRRLRYTQNTVSSAEKKELEEIQQKRANRGDVIRTYIAMLGRPPESEAVIIDHLNLAQTVHDLVVRIAKSDEFAHIIGHNIGAASSPLSHFNTSVNVQSIIKSYINHDREPIDEHYVNFLGMAKYGRPA